MRYKDAGRTLVGSVKLWAARNSLTLLIEWKAGPGGPAFEVCCYRLCSGGRPPFGSLFCCLCSSRCCRSCILCVCLPCFCCTCSSCCCCRRWSCSSFRFHLSFVL